MSSAVGTSSSNDDIAFMRTSTTLGLAAAIRRDLEVVKTSICAIRENIVILDVFAHRGNGASSVKVSRVRLGIERTRSCQERLI